MTPSEVLQLMRKLARIDGWFSLEAAMLFAWVDEIQRSNGISGDLFEIGVHHGRSAALLAALARANGDALGACDLFDEQSQNVSRSGRGDLGRFERNIAEVAPGVELRLHVKRSQDLVPAQIGTRHRFFHIDGGHDCDDALRDLELAAASTVSAGAILVDDPFRPEWPGVTEAIIAFLRIHTRYAAVLIGFNKMLIVDREFAELYGLELARIHTHEYWCILYPWQIKVLPFLGHPVRIFFIPSYASRQSIRARLVRFGKTSRIARVALSGASWMTGKAPTP